MEKLKKINIKEFSANPFLAAGLKLAKAYQEAGGRAMLVGGAVRDLLLGIQPKDIDLEVYGLAVDKVEAIAQSMGRVEDVGRAFAILRVEIDGVWIEVALPRTEVKTGEGHKAFDVTPDPSLSPEAAARRRDFTVNAIAVDTATGEIVDPFGGQQDLVDGILRVVDQHTFVEDPLRVLRAMQFIGRFGFAVEEESERLMKSMVPTLEELPRERIGAEWRKLLLQSNKPSLGLMFTERIGVLDVLHPELPPLRQTPQEPEWHPEGDVWVHTCMVVDAAAKIVRDEKLDDEAALITLFGGLCHDIGKPYVTKMIDGRIRSIGHEEAGEKPTRILLAGLCVDERTIDAVVGIVKDHMKPYRMWASDQAGEKITDGAIRRLAQRIHPATMCDLVRVCCADYRGRGPFVDSIDSSKKIFHVDYQTGPWLLDRAEKLAVKEGPPASLVRGEDLLALGFTPGPRMGELIRWADEQRDEKNMTKEQVLEELKKMK